PNEIAYELDKALNLATHGRKGPVWIDVPLDVQNMRVEPSELHRFKPEEEIDYTPSAEDLTYVANALLDAERPVLLLGSGVRSADAIPELKAFLKTYPIPVTFANSAVDTYGAAHSLSMGVVASIGGTRCGNFTVQNADLLL